MNDKEKSRFTMFKNVQSTVNTFGDIVKMYPKLEQHYSNFVNEVELLKQNDVVYSTVKLGTTDQKNSAKEALAGTLARRCRTVTALAVDINDLELKAIVDISEGNLKVLSNEDISKKAKIILEKIKQHKQELAEYGLGDEEITELETAITDYDSKLDNKESKSQTSVVARSDLSDIFSKADGILAQLDNIIQGLSKKHAELSKNYFQARNIRGSGGGSHGGPADPGSGGGDNNPPKAGA
ncbi:MAG: hypothetical protein Q8908_05360 [Bacteroidota bacterium]|nr:hypothetical protein [Bacteroidota bacterium]